MCRVRRLGFVLLPVLVLAWPMGRSAAAQTTKEARGTVTAVSDGSMTVKVGAQDMTFAVDGKTRVLASGAGRRTRNAKAAGAAGIKLTDVVKTGGAVLVLYREAGGTMQAVEVRAISTAGAGGGSVTDPGKIASGKVKSVTADALVITGDNNKDMTFAVNANTRVIAKGAGSATTAAGGRITITGLVSAGDSVSVTYVEAGTAMRATEVRITVKAR